MVIAVVTNIFFLLGGTVTISSQVLRQVTKIFSEDIILGRGGFQSMFTEENYIRELNL